MGATRVMWVGVGIITIAVLIFSSVDRPSETPPAPVAAASPTPAPEKKSVTVALSQWPGHLALVVGNGGLTTQPGSAAALAGLDLTITFIEDAPSKNKALIDNKVDAVWETVDELPIALGSFRAAEVDARAFIQIDWSRGGDACVASANVQKVEDVLGRKAAVLLFSP